MVEAFSEIGVSADMLRRHLGRELESIEPGELTSLKGIYRSIRDGNSNVAEHFGDIGWGDEDSSPSGRESRAKFDMRSARAKEEDGPGPRERAEEKKADKAVQKVLDAIEAQGVHHDVVLRHLAEYDSEVAGMQLPDVLAGMRATDRLTLLDSIAAGDFNDG